MCEQVRTITVAGQVLGGEGLLSERWSKCVNSGWPPACSLLPSASRIVGSRVCVTMPGQSRGLEVSCFTFSVLFSSFCTSRNKLNNFGNMCLVLIVFSGIQKSIHFNQYSSIQLHSVQSLTKEGLKRCTELYTETVHKALRTQKEHNERWLILTIV